MAVPWDVCSTAVIGFAASTIRCCRREKICVSDKFDSGLRAKLTASTLLSAIALVQAISALVDDQAALLCHGISFLGTLYLTFVLAIEHRHSARPLIIVSVLLACDVLLSTLAWLCIPSVPKSRLLSLIVKMHILYLHEKPSWKHLIPEIALTLDRNETYGVWSRCLSLSFLDQINQEPVDKATPSKTNPISDNYLESLPLRKFTSKWVEYVTHDFRLAWVCAYVLKEELIVAGISVLCTVFFDCMVPFCISGILRHLQSQTSLPLDNESNNSEKFVVGWVFVVMAGWLLSRAWMRYAISNVKLGARLVLSEATFDKLQKRPGVAAIKLAKLSIIAEDIPAIEEIAGQFFYSARDALEATLALFIVCRENNVLILLMVVHLFVLVISSESLGTKASQAATRAFKAMEERSSAVATMLMSMQGIKTLNETNTMKYVLECLRLREKEVYRGWRTIRIGPQIIQAYLNAFSDMYLLAIDFSADDGAVMFPHFIQTYMVCYLFREATITTIHKVQQFMQAREAFDRVQNFFQQPSYEIDVRYSVRQDFSSHFALQFTDVTIMPEASSDEPLRHVNLVLNRGTLTVITGDDRRSVLLQAAIGNCTLNHGFIKQRAGTISYCGKEIWVQNVSIRDNIVGDSLFRAGWYRNVLQACCLERDIASLPEGSDFVVETSGKILSASQLQRIAFARSLYSRAALLVLDDVLCYQDAASATELIQNLLAPNGILRHGTTVLISAENWQLYADIGAQFITMESTGQISRTAERVLRVNSTQQEVINSASGQTRQFQKDRYFAGSAAQLMTRELLSTIRTEEPIAQTCQEASFSRYIGNRTAMFILGSVLIFTVVAVEVLQITWIVEYLRTGLTLRQGLTYLTQIVALGPIWVIATWIISMNVIDTSCNDMYDKLLSSLLNARYEFFNNENIKRSMYIACEGFRTLHFHSYPHLIAIVYNNATLLSIPFIAIRHNPVVFLALGFGAASIHVFHDVYHPLWHKVTERDSHARRQLQTHFIETATGSVYFRALGWELKHASQSRTYIESCQQAKSIAEGLQRWLELSGDVFSVLLFLGSFLCGLYGLVELYGVGLMMLVSMYTFEVFTFLMRGLSGMSNALCILKEMEDLIEAIPQESEAGASALTLPTDLVVGGDIQLKDASFGYQQDGKLLITNIDLNIPRGTGLGIYGDGPSGKSALLLSLCGNLPYTGSITVDGKEVRDLPRDRLQDMFITLPETSVVFPGATVLETLFPPEITSPGRLVRCMKSIARIVYELGLADLVEDVGGYHSKFEDLFLTADQMHLFALARAMIKFLFERNLVVIIDSITSRVSFETYLIMREVLENILYKASNTVVYTFGHPDTFLNSTDFVRINDGKLEPLVPIYDTDEEEETAGQ